MYPHLPHPENRLHPDVWVVYTRRGAIITNKRERIPSRFLSKVKHSDWFDTDILLEREQLVALGVSVRVTVQ